MGLLRPRRLGTSPSISHYNVERGAFIGVASCLSKSGAPSQPIAVSHSQGRWRKYAKPSRFVMRYGTIARFDRSIINSQVSCRLVAAGTVRQRADSTGALITSAEAPNWGKGRAEIGGCQANATQGNPGVSWLPGWRSGVLASRFKGDSIRYPIGVRVT